MAEGSNGRQYTEVITSPAVLPGNSKHKHTTNTNTNTCGNSFPTLDEKYFHQEFRYSSDSDDGLTDALSRDSSSTGSPEPSASECEMYQLLDHDFTREVGKDVYDIRDIGSMASFVNSRIECGLEPGSFLVTNLNPILTQLQQWRHELPMVEPFYAVKCNPDPAILRLLASHGCKFDCASMGEIDLVLNGLGDDLSFGNRGLAKSSIVYANPAKMEHMLRFALENDVSMTVFDGEDELHKIAAAGGHNMELLLRITTDDKASICRFSKKFGCPVAEAPRLLDIAKSLGLRVAGVSFHVGSGCGDPDAYSKALSDAREVFNYANFIGMPPLQIIDVGGGFPGDAGGYGGPGMPTFQDLARSIRKGIESFAVGLTSGLALEQIRFIAEPGRYFVSACTVIATKIYARKGGDSDYQALYVDDGVYGSFNTVLYDHATPVPQRLSSVLKNLNKGSVATGETGEENRVQDGNEECLIPTAVFGPTCDGLDQMCSLESTHLPRCRVGEWLFWENQGAYTHTASFVFNGYTHWPQKTYCIL